MSWWREGAIVLAAALLASGCATVKAYEREYLADPIMSLELSNRDAARDVSWIEAREGSTGGMGGAGGGCEALRPE